MSDLISIKITHNLTIIEENAKSFNNVLDF